MKTVLATAAYNEASILLEQPTLFAIEKKRQTGQVIGIVLGFLVLVLGFLKLGIYPDALFKGFGKLLVIIGMFFPPGPGIWLADFSFALLETLAMAFLGTLFGFLLAIPLGFLAAKNVVGQGLIRSVIRMVMNVFRGIDSMIWALMFVHVVGLGPFAGIMAIMIVDMATFAKIFAEAIENADSAPVTGIKSTGANMFQSVRYGIFPQVLPIFLSNGLYFFESNVRSASILGVLGAGGIGMQLSDRMRIMNFPEAGFIVLMILVTVFIIDTISKNIRMKIIFKKPRVEEHYEN